MRRAPVMWDTGRWDIGGRGTMGVDSIPTLHDANLSGYIPTEFQPGIGRSNDIYMRGLTEGEGRQPYPQGNVPSGYMWNPEVQGGFFYIGQDQYYLFSRKHHTTGVPVPESGRLQLGDHNDRWPTGGAPIIVTVGSSEFTATQPFGRTYESTPSGILPRTPVKMRKVTDLMGRKEWQLDASGNLVPYSFVHGNMQFTVGASGIGSPPSGYSQYVDTFPSGATITVETEIGVSGYMTTHDVDMNPLNSYEVQNTFLAIASGDLVPGRLFLDTLSRYQPTVSQRVAVIGAVKDVWGAPISGATVTFTDDAIGDFNEVNPTTIWDGTVTTMYTLPSLYVAAGATITMTYGGLSEQIWVPLGRTPK